MMGTLFWYWVSNRLNDLAEALIRQAHVAHLRAKGEFRPRKLREPGACDYYYSVETMHDRSDEL